ncbi:MAG: translational GTPase TypA [Candidatus Omnitrophica bacterium]|nr:translational GTPase TypA [Candidatus Omnitrophota bacterium]
MKPNALRNIAIIAHVDHGKTTLVDAIFRQTQVHRNIETMGERVMDSMDLEKERGITIRAKNASVLYRGTKINIVDTPGHADFGGEVERTLRMVDGVLLLVDAKDGPMPQTRFVLRKALELGHQAIVVVNKVDLLDAQPEETVNKTFDLFCELNAHDKQLDFSVVFTSAVRGTATLDLKKPSENIFPLLDLILEKIPPPRVDAEGPLQILILALLADYYKGRMGIGKISAGRLRQGDTVVLLKRDGRQIASKVTAILSYEGLERKEVEEASAGEIVAVAGFEEVGIGDTLADPAQPQALPVPQIDEPTIRMTFAVNTSPFSGKEGKQVTSRALRERLTKELETNVSLRVEETDSPDTFLVSGRGELHLAILIETMRREGFEMQVSQPEVIFKERDGVRLEPFEFLTVDAPADYRGVIIEEVGSRRGALENMITTTTGEIHFEYNIPTRGVMGLKSALLTSCRGTAQIHHVFDDYKPVLEASYGKTSRGSLIAFEGGTSTAYALANCQLRGEMFIGPGVEVYQGMIIGANPRGEDLEISPVKTKKLTNVRSSTSDIAVVLTPPKAMTLEMALEYIGPDELVEATPQNIRLRKKLLDPIKRKRARKETDDA